jgi:hypothetical protein
MKNLMNNKPAVFFSMLTGTWLMAVVAFGNPTMLPDHPGYPIKATKSPVSGVSTANDPGQENFYGQEAINAATKADNQEMSLFSKTALEEGTMEEKKDEESSMKSK